MRRFWAEVLEVRWLALALLFVVAVLSVVAAVLFALVVSR